MKQSTPMDTHLWMHRRDSKVSERCYQSDDEKTGHERVFARNKREFRRILRKERNVCSTLHGSLTPRSRL